MRNRAKCKLCKDVLESFHKHDYVVCSCGEIGIDGGDYYFKSSARDYKNFLRLDDNDNEIPVTLKDEGSGDVFDRAKDLNKQDMLNMLDDMIKSIERLPPHAMGHFITHSDWVSTLMLISSLFKACE